MLKINYHHLFGINYFILIKYLVLYPFIITCFDSQTFVPDFSSSSFTIDFIFPIIIPLLFPKTPLLTSLDPITHLLMIFLLINFLIDFLASNLQYPFMNYFH